MQITLQRLSVTRIALIFSVVLLASCSAPPPNLEIEFDVPVEVETVELGNVESFVVATGMLRTRGSVAVRTKTTGRIYIASDEDGNRLTEGHVIKAGDLLAQITGEEQRLHAGIEVAQKSLENAEAELERRRELFSQQLISQAELTQQELAVANSRAAYDQAKLNASNAVVYADTDGVILILARDNNNQPVADGQLVSQEFLVAQIAPLDVLEADVDLIGPDLSRVKIGQQVRITHYAFDDLAIVGKVIRLSPTVNPQTRTFQAVVSIPNPDLLLKPGMIVEVNIIVEQRLQVPVVKRESLSRRAGGNVVFVLDGQRVEQRQVRIGLREDFFAEVLEGIVPGDTIVVSGLETLTNGTKVRVLGR